MIIRWIVGGLEIPNIGKIEIDKIRDVPEEIGMELIRRGIAVNGEQEEEEEQA